MKGRPPKPLSQHEADGTSRTNRHGNRIEQHFRHGEPAPPSDLKGDGLALWNDIIRGMPKGVMCEVDWAALSECCRWYQIASQISRLLADYPLESKVMTMGATATAKFQAYMMHFGLSPVARAKLSSTAATNDTANPFEQLKAIKAG